MLIVAPEFSYTICILPTIKEITSRDTECIGYQFYSC